MAWYRVFYVGIGGREDYADIEAEDSFEARKEFEKTYWSYHEILKVEEANKSQSIEQ